MPFHHLGTLTATTAVTDDGAFDIILAGESGYAGTTLLDPAAPGAMMSVTIFGGLPDYASGAGGGPHVKVFDGKTGAELKSFYAYDPGFSDGVTVAATTGTVVTGPGPGGGSLVKVFGLAVIDPADPQTRLDLVVGAGPGGGPNVKVYDGLDGTPVSSTFAFDPASAGGAIVG